MIQDLETLLLELSDIQNKLPMLQNLQDGVITTIPGTYHVFKIPVIKHVVEITGVQDRSGILIVLVSAVMPRYSLTSSRCLGVWG